MEPMPEVTGEETLFNENPIPFPNFANFSPPSVAMLSLRGFTIGLMVWLFSTNLILNTQTITARPSFSSQPSSPSQHNQPHVDPLPSSPNISYSLSSSLLGKCLDPSNEVTKKKRK